MGSDPEFFEVQKLGSDPISATYAPNPKSAFRNPKLNTIIRDTSSKPETCHEKSHCVDLDYCRIARYGTTRADANAGPRTTAAGRPTRPARWARRGSRRAGPRSWPSKVGVGGSYWESSRHDRPTASHDPRSGHLTRRQKSCSS